MLDIFADHCLVCPCGGDRTIRHNGLRNLVHTEAFEAGVRPEKEKAGLLPPAASDDSAPADPRSSRRPADVWIPRGASGRGEALDFAVTSGLRSDRLQQVIQSTAQVFERYEETKRNHLRTDELCSAAGFAFVPMIMEAHGGAWSPTARSAMEWIARQKAAATGESFDATSLRFAQLLSCSLHRENARAVLKRSVAAEPPAHRSGWEMGAHTWQ